MTKDKQDRSLELRQQCTNCGGNGSIQTGFGTEFCPYEMLKCPDCNGTGLIDDHSEEDKPFRVMGFAEEWDWSNDEPEPPTIYIAGPMRGYPQLNFPAFDAAEKELREQGWNVLNPAQMDRDIGFDPNDVVTKEFILDAMLRDTTVIIQQADAIALLAGWDDSDGGTAETLLSKWKDIPVYTMPHDGKPFGRLERIRVISSVITDNRCISMFDYHKELTQNDSTD